MKPAIQIIEASKSGRKWTNRGNWIMVFILTSIVLYLIHLSPSIYIFIASH
jgi:hypothetical protein